MSARSLVRRADDARIGVVAVVRYSTVPYRTVKGIYFSYCTSTVRGLHYRGTRTSTTMVVRVPVRTSTLHGPPQEHHMPDLHPTSEWVGTLGGSIIDRGSLSDQGPPWSDELMTPPHDWSS